MRKTRFRSGFSLVELQVAFVLFGIALAGLGPLVVMQIRHFERIERRFSDQVIYYLVPSSDVWVRRLGAPASIRAQDVGSVSLKSVKTTDPVHQVQILSVEKSLTDDAVTAHVSVTPVPKTEPPTKPPKPPKKSPKEQDPRKQKPREEKVKKQPAETLQPEKRNGNGKQTETGVQQGNAEPGPKNTKEPSQGNRK